MESIKRNVAEMNAADRQALEHVVGQRLRANQQIIIQIVNADEQPPRASDTSQAGKLPEWCDVYGGLAAEQITDLEQSVLTRADFSRTTD